MPRYYLIAGEASGDLHASRLIGELKKISPDASFRGWGGDLMEAAGMVLVKHYRELAFMGFSEVIAHLPAIFRNITLAKKELLTYAPDVLILIDYPGFNLRIAKFAKRNNIRVFYYISPQIWAWKQSRVHQIKRDVERMFVILPFEKDFYARFGVEVDFPGHPLPEVIENYRGPSSEEFYGTNHLDHRPIVAVLPGSRRQEINRVLPLMLAMRLHFQDYQFVVAAAPGLPHSFYEKLTSHTDVKVLRGQTYALLSHSHAAVVTSGTASLETALFGIPEVVCYKGGWISYMIARLLIKVKYIGLANLIMNRMIVKELIQTDFNEKNLRSTLDKLLNDQHTRELAANEYSLLKKTLGDSGVLKATALLMYKRLMNIAR